MNIRENQLQSMKIDDIDEKTIKHRWKSLKIDGKSMNTDENQRASMNINCN